MKAQSTLFRRSFSLILVILFLGTLAVGWNQASTQKPVVSRMGQITDWSSHYVQYPQGASLAALALSQRDPRAYWNYINLMNQANAAQLAEQLRLGQRLRQRVPPNNPDVDWSVALGPAGIAADQYPAKYSFNIHAAPDCVNDFVVFGINATPSTTQANIAAFNNLYSGSSPTGICSGTTATVYWAYHLGGAPVSTSPSLSLDGTKVAFVVSANPAVFHVLTWKANTGTVFAPAAPTTITNLTLTGATDTASSPFIDYINDIAYVGTGNGRLYKIHPVFTGTPALAAAPWPITGLGGTMTSPVIEFKTGNIFIGDSLGKLYGFTPAGAAVPGSPATIGSGRTHGTITDPPLVDSLNGLVYVVTGENSARTSAIVAQLSSSNLSTVVTAPIGLNNTTNIHSPAFNTPYLLGKPNMPGTTQEWFIYACGVAAGRPVPRCSTAWDLPARPPR